MLGVRRTARGRLFGRGHYCEELKLLPIGMDRGIRLKRARLDENSAADMLLTGSVASRMASLQIFFGNRASGCAILQDLESLGGEGAACAHAGFNSV